MSRYCEVQTEFKNAEALVQALMETGNWGINQIETHELPTNLYGYKGDVRSEQAHIVIRRHFVGGASNDVGFRKMPDGTYKALISEFDQNKYNNAWIAKLKGNYAYHLIKKQQEARGRRVVRERLSNGHQRIAITGYR